MVTASIENGVLKLQQQRFLSSPVDKDKDASLPNEIPEFGYKWIVPITLVDEKNPRTERLYWLNSTETEIPLSSSDVKWVKLNVNQTGFYRVNYNESIWQQLSDTLKKASPNSHALSATDRANLIDDAFVLMKTGQLSVDLVMDLTMYLENGERDYIPWKSALHHFAILDILMLKYPPLHAYISKLIKPMVRALGWQDSGSHLERKLRSTILGAAVNCEDEETIASARGLFRNWKERGAYIPPNIREVVYATGVRYGGMKEWGYCWEKYKNSTVPSEKRLLLNALGSTQNLWLLSQFLNYSLDRSKIKPQDTVTVISYVSRNSLGRTLVWKFIRENWPTILSLFGQGSFSMDSIISETTWYFSSQFEYEEAKNFFGSVGVGSGMQAVNQSLERIRGNIYWKDHVEPQIISWLSKNFGQDSR